VTFHVSVPQPLTHFRHYDAGALAVTRKINEMSLNVGAATGTGTRLNHFLLCTMHGVHIPLFELLFLWTGIKTRISLTSATHYGLSAGLDGNVLLYHFHLYIISHYIHS
jgi:hypothetical protein